ncbi:MAG: carboxypeptidase regulatory-like domain-containing protein, partial [Planctomycetes bacterium]|nr:carboxypeptidase regulatory-like domain-containing protein [Planctomycetota bacterium]
LDTTAPIVTITSPTSGDTNTATGSTVSLSGNASDSLSGISSVTWINDKGGSGDASGTTYWSISSISLVSGDNKITVTAKDNVGNTSTDTITVTYTASTAPTVKTGSAINVTTNSATLSGTVNANGLSTTAWFEYGTVKGSYGSKSSTQGVSGSTDTTVSITITGLTAGTTYYYRIAAQSNSGTSFGEEMSFYKSSVENPPTVATEAATDITNTTAKLNGKCNPNGQSTTAWFEYGVLSGTYNYQTSTQGVSGSSYTNVSATITGLTVGTKYYYRIAAQNSAGTSYGTEMSFYKSTDTQTTPTPQTSPTPATTPVPTPTTTEKGVIVGTVADEEAGIGIAGAKITTDKGGYSATTGFDGTYTIENVSAGDYTLTASADGYKSSSQAVTVYAGEASAADFILTRESGGGIVFGFVLDENGDSLKGVTVTITNDKTQSTETDDNGYYEFSGLEAGGYTLTFEKSGYTNQTLDITLKAEEILEAETVTMELEVKGSIYGYAVDIHGNPIESVKLKLKGIKTKIKRNASSDADGFFEFADLEADKYVIFASKKRYKKTKQTVSLDEGDDQKIEIEMRKSSSSRRVIPETEE